MASSNAVKSCTHIEGIQMKKRTEVFLLLLHNTFLIISCVENTKRIQQNFRFCWIKKIRMFKEIFLCTFSEYYSIMMHSNFHSILPKNGQENGTETWLLAKKMHNGENAFEVLLYSSTCHERTPSGPGKSVRTWQAAAHQRDGRARGTKRNTHCTTI